MNRLIKGIAMIMTLAIISACSFLEPNTELLAPPQLPGTQADIKKAFDRYIPTNAELLTPINHKHYNNPIILTDLDDDGIEEAIAFYKSKRDATSIHGVVLKNNNGWKKIASINGAGSILVDVQLEDLNGDEKKEILIGVSYSEDSKERGLFVFDIFSSDKPIVLLNELYTHFLVDHFSNPARQELILIKYARELTNSIYLYSYKENQLEPIAHLELDPYINGYYNIVSGMIAPTKRGLMLDAAVGAHSGITYVISVENGKLINVFRNPEDQPFKVSAVISLDSNGDGILEFGLLEEPYMETPLAYAHTPYITAYYQMDDQFNTTLVSKAYYNYNFRYKIDIPLDWEEIKLTQSEDHKAIEISDPIQEEVLFDVYVTDKKYVLEEDWILLGETNAYMYWSRYATEENKHYFQLLTFE